MYTHGHPGRQTEQTKTNPRNAHSHMLSALRESYSSSFWYEGQKKCQIQKVEAHNAFGTFCMCLPSTVNSSSFFARLCHICAPRTYVTANILETTEIHSTRTHMNTILTSCLEYENSRFPRFLEPCMNRSLDSAIFCVILSQSKETRRRRSSISWTDALR